MKNARILFIIGMLFILAVPLFAQPTAPPHIINYQGKLTDTSGVGINDTLPIIFLLYDTASGGSPLWLDTVEVQVLKGLFDAQLDLSIGGGDTLKFDRPYWMELVVNGETMSPREKLAPVAFAFRSIYADTADYASSSSGGSVPSGAYVAFPDSFPRTGWTYTGYFEVKIPWKYKACMPTARSGLAAAAVNNKIYAIGGWNTSGYLSTNEEYDPSTDTWTTKASMPTARGNLAAAAANYKIYAIGGRTNSSYFSTNEEYDPSTDTWTTKASMSAARSDLAAAVVNNKIYAIGGEPSGGGYIQRNEEYDPSTNTWTTKVFMPTARRYLAAAAVNNKIYAIGGLNSSSLSTNEEYDPSTDTWTTKASMPTARYGLVAAAVHNKIYAIGGYNTISSSYLSTNEEYDPSTDTWTTKESMPTAREGLAAAVVNNEIYAIGGFNNSVGECSANEKYNPVSFTFYWFQKD